MDKKFWHGSVWQYDGKSDTVSDTPLLLALFHFQIAISFSTIIKIICDLGTCLVGATSNSKAFRKISFIVCSK